MNVWVVETEICCCGMELLGLFETEKKARDRIAKEVELDKRSRWEYADVYEKQVE